MTVLEYSDSFMAEVRPFPVFNMNGRPPASSLNRLSLVILSEVELKSTSS